MKVTIYPYSINKGDIRVNPYISDFIHALQQNGITIANPPHKNPLFSLIPRKADSDAYIFPLAGECTRLQIWNVADSCAIGFFSKLNATIKRSSGSCTISSPM